jgi:hypothetical protein
MDGIKAHTQEGLLVYRCLLPAKEDSEDSPLHVGRETQTYVRIECITLQFFDRGGRVKQRALMRSLETKQVRPLLRQHAAKRLIRGRFIEFHFPVPGVPGGVAACVVFVDRVVDFLPYPWLVFPSPVDNYKPFYEADIWDFIQEPHNLMGGYSVVIRLFLSYRDYCVWV